MKQAGGIIVMSLTTICNKVWKSEEVPEDWKNEIIQPSPKTGGGYIFALHTWKGMQSLK